MNKQTKCVKELMICYHRKESEKKRDMRNKKSHKNIFIFVFCNPTGKKIHKSDESSTLSLIAAKKFYQTDGNVCYSKYFPL